MARDGFREPIKPYQRTYAGQVGSSLSCIGVLWAIMSFTCAGLSCVGFYMPYWLEGKIHNKTDTFLGTFRRCNYPKWSEQLEGVVVVMEECGRYSTFTDIPSLWWQVATISVGVGCGLSIIVSFTALLACCCQDVVTSGSAKVLGIFQFIAGLSIGAGCILYPLGWDSEEVKNACGYTSGLFYLGTCKIGWAYWTTVAGAGSALFSALLSCNAAKTRFYGRYRV